MSPPTRATDPLLHYGRHFGRTVHALCTVSSILTNGILRLTDDDERADEEYPPEERRDWVVFCKLTEMIPNLKERLADCTNEGLLYTATTIQKGISCARSDDTRGLKGAILDWIVPRGETLRPPLYRNVKHDRGFFHERTGYLLCPAEYDWANDRIKEQLRNGELPMSGDLWPTFVYKDYKVDPDDIWANLFRSSLLVAAYKYIFTSPSSVEREAKATRSGNARIHGMKEVTLPSIAYVATQVRFSLCSSSVFTRNDTNTDSERFYHSILDLLEDPEELKEVNELRNCQIFPGALTIRPLPKDGTLAKIKARRKALQEKAQNRQNE
ncbi:hypothetical protein FIBSPDRAFT_915387 [Athelia psychrophila]|uniref:Fungal-type protein kinase domain-containing protein n=1 Tax=Athelia psychrophila TaxID=1759441 RepID=A0A167TKM9_9AGAM|nr:hypothetical protein FIBSPDRAFT_915387 [Fibularhizoctonia sp. CBS 109695]